MNANSVGNKLTNLRILINVLFFYLHLRMAIDVFQISDIYFLDKIYKVRTHHIIPSLVLILSQVQMFDS